MSQSGLLCNFETRSPFLCPKCGEGVLNLQWRRGVAAHKFLAACRVSERARAACGIWTARIFFHLIPESPEWHDIHHGNA